MSHAEARAWWADVEHLREAAERRQAAETRRRAEAAPRRARREEPVEGARARARAVARVREEGVDELTARRAVAADERAPRPRRPVPIWLADDEDAVASARARASAPRRTVEIRGQLVPTLQARPPLGLPGDRELARRRAGDGIALGALLAGRPDRVAFWAFALGLALVLAAVLTAQ
jgi:hypothetical protein